DALPVEVLRVDDRLHRDVLAARDASEARARDAAALVVVVARRVAVDGCDHAHVRLVELRDLGLAVAHAGVVLAGDLAVHVDADEQTLAALLRDGERVLPGALPLDQARLLPV